MGIENPVLGFRFGNFTYIRMQPYWMRRKGKIRGSEIIVFNALRHESISLTIITGSHRPGAGAGNTPAYSRISVTSLGFHAEVNHSLLRIEERLMMGWWSNI